MRVFLLIFCGVIALFSGGCALMLSSFSGMGMVGMPIFILAGACVLNVLVIAALLGWKKPWKPAFYFLAVADICIAVGVMLLALVAAASDASLIPFAALFAAAFAAKGVLTYRFATTLSGPEK